MLSILLPSYENSCLALVTELQRQASVTEDLDYEIIVVEDGGCNAETKATDNAINELPNCRYITADFNRGRAAVRNYLASLSAGEWLLFIDSDVVPVGNDFISHYARVLKAHEGECIAIDGGVKVIGNPADMSHNLRFLYEYEQQPLHTAELRKAQPYRSIHTANLLVPRGIMMEKGFDERIRRYGYEDVLFGKTLEKAGIEMFHINAPVGLYTFESNAVFLEKTCDALQTLHIFYRELQGYSTLLDSVNRLQRFHLMPAVRLWHRLFANIEKHNLLSGHPSLTVFKLYKLGYYASL